MLVEQISQQAKDLKDPHLPAWGLAGAGAASGSAVPKGGEGAAIGTRSVSCEFSRLCSFLQVALGSSWDF